MASAIRALVIVVAEERVERSMVLLPMTTRLLDLPDSVRTGAEEDARDEAGTTVLVATCDVIVLPELSVVVMATEVRTVEDAVSSAAAELSVLDGLSLVDASLELSALLVVVVASDVEGVIWMVLDVEAAAVDWSLMIVDESEVSMVEVGVVDVVETSAEDVDVSLAVSLVEVGEVEVLVVTPVPTAWRLLGMMPSLTASALICAKPRTGKSENMASSSAGWYVGSSLPVMCQTEPSELLSPTICYSVPNALSVMSCDWHNRASLAIKPCWLRGGRGVQRKFLL